MTRATAATRRRVRTLTAAAAPAPMAAAPGVVLDRGLRRLGLPGEPRTQLHLAVAIASAVVAAAAVVGPAAGATTAVAVVAGWEAWRRGAGVRRAAADERELPHLLERVARHLRAGGSLAQAFVAATPAPSPAADRAIDGLGAAWRRVAARGAAIGMVAALDEWAESTSERPTSSVRLAAAALAVAASTGGSPARAVDGVAATLRSRLAAAEEVRALSSQARASALVIAVAPLGFGVVAAATDDRTAAFLGTPAGAALVAAGLLLDGVGAGWMARLCRVRP